jgi:hypothetical protein
MDEDEAERVYISYREFDGHLYVLRTPAVDVFRELPEYQEYPDIWAALHFLVITPGAVDNT